LKANGIGLALAQLVGVYLGDVRVLHIRG
jgi:hypothetical protein